MRQFRIPSSAPTTELPHPLPQLQHPSEQQTPPSIAPGIRRDNWQPPMFHNAITAYLGPEYPSCKAASGKVELCAKRMPLSYHATAPADCSQNSFNRFPIAQSPDRSIPHRSISPNTISIDPIAATTSASSPPSHIFGKVCRFAKQAARMCTRYGLAVPSLTM
jgi:hypothetical protein